MQPRSIENQDRGQGTGVTGAVGPRSLGPESGSLGYARRAGTRPLSNGLDLDPSQFRGLSPSPPFLTIQGKTFREDMKDR